MSKLIVRWILLTVAIIAASAVTQMLGLGFEAKVAGVGDFLLLMLGAGILAFLNATLGSAMRMMTLPLTCITFGLFSLVVNAIVLLVASLIAPNITVEGFWAAFVGSLLISIVNSLLRSLIPMAQDAND